MLPIFFLFALLIVGLPAKDVVVTSLDDHGPDTLREALLNVQDEDIIQFDSSCAGQSIVLESSLPQIHTNCMVLGPIEGNVTIDGQEMFEVFHISDGRFTLGHVDIKNPTESLAGSGVFVDTNALVLLSDLTFSSLATDPQECPISVSQDGRLRLSNISFTTEGEPSSKQVLLETDSALVLRARTSLEPETVVDGAGNVYKRGAEFANLITASAVDPTADPADITIVVDQGTLAFMGSTTQPIIISPGAALRGNHSSLYIANAGVVKPGNSIGTVVTLGDFIQVAQGTLQIELSPSGASDFVQVGQNAFLAGTLHLLPERGVYYKGDVFHFLTTGGAINGSFDTVISASAGLAYQVEYSPTSIQIGILKNLISYDGDTISGNAGAVVSVLENIYVAPGSDMRAVIGFLNALDPPAPLIEALDQLQPAACAALGWTEAATLHQIGAELTRARRSFCGRPCKTIPCCTQDKPQGLWISGIGEFLYQGKLNRLEGFHATSGGAVVGYDHAIEDRVTLGLSCAYTHTDLVWKKNRGSAKINGYYAAAYSALCLGRLLVDASFLASFYQDDLARKIHFTGVHRTAESSPKGSGLMGHIGVRLPYKLSPFATGEYVHLHRNKFKEKGARSLDLSVESTAMNFVRGELGLLFEKRFCVSWGAIVPSAALSYVYFAPTSNTHLRAHFVEFAEKFTVKTTDHAFHEVSPAVSLGFIIGKNIWVSATYTGEFAPKRCEQDLSAALRWQF